MPLYSPVAAFIFNHKSTFMAIRLSILFMLLSFHSLCQNSEKVLFDAKDSADGYYLAVRPPSKIEGVVVLLTSFLPPERLLPETSLHNVAYANGLLTVVASTKQKLYADSSAVNRISALLKDIVGRFRADTSRFALAGYDEAGSIALRYTELTYEQGKGFPVQPKAVFGIDTPVDIAGLWHWSEAQIKKNYWPGAVGDARYYLETMTKENGSLYHNAERYKALSPFYRESDSAGHEQYLKTVAVRLYYDLDIDWQLKNRRNSFYDTKMPDGSELIKRLLLWGNDKAELVSARQPGVRSNGVRHPTSLSIVDEVECIQWIKKSLDIFDAASWMPPYHLLTPAGWAMERFALPPDFAPQITYKGVEDIRFAPGWGDIKSEEHWAYGFLWWLEGAPDVNAHMLEANLKAYYTGLVARNTAGGNIPVDKIVPVTVILRKIKALPASLETYSGTISMLDYHSGQPITLNCRSQVKDSKIPAWTAIYFTLSPKPFLHPVWQKLAQIGESFAGREQ
jgi:hypothetical protein